MQNPSTPTRLGSPCSLQPAWALVCCFTGWRSRSTTSKSRRSALSPGTQETAVVGTAATVFHWGVHAWSIYGVVGLALGYFAYNRGLPLTVRSAFYPLFGDRIWGWPGHIIDTFAIFAGLFGLATSLGLGVKQLTSGLNYLFDVPANDTTMVVLIVVITSIALISVLAGINVGIKRLSQFNIILALLLLLAVIALGPTLYHRPQYARRARQLSRQNCAA